MADLELAPHSELTLTWDEIIQDYRIAYRSRQVSLVGWREVMSGKAKFGIFGSGKELPQLAMAHVFQKGDFRSGYYRDQTFMFATGMTCSHEQLIMDEEISAMARHIAAGITVSDDTIAGDLIKQIGSRGSYLTCEHTLEHLRSAEYLAPRVSVRGPRATWQAAGAKDTATLAAEKARQYNTCPGTPLDPDKIKRLPKI